MLATLVDDTSRRLRNDAAYRRAIAQNEAMSRQDLAALRTYGSDLHEAAPRDMLHR